MKNLTILLCAIFIISVSSERYKNDDIDDTMLDDEDAKVWDMLDKEVKAAKKEKEKHNNRNTKSFEGNDVILQDSHETYNMPSKSTQQFHIKRDSEGLPCPHGCRCSSSPHLHRRYHWHKLLVRYRMRHLVYGGHQQIPSHRLLQQPLVHPKERELTCFGLTDMPDSLPSNVNKVIFYGDTKGSPYQGDEPSDSEFGPFKNGATKNNGYHQLTSISKYTFVGASSMKELVIENNRIKILHPDEFSLMTSLEKMNLKNNRLKVISVNAFKGLEKLEELDLKKNHIKRLSRSTFRPLISLKSLNLAENRLRSVHTKLFVSLVNLKDLDLSYNHIKDIGKDAFYGMKSLTHLYMGNNNLKQIRPEWFTSMKNLIKLDMRGNRIEGIPDGAFLAVPLLRNLILESNQIPILRRSTFGELSELKYLRIQKNNITEIESYSFAGLKSLEELHLGSNDIAKIDNKTLYGLENLKSLILSENQLIEISNDDLQPILNVEKLDFSNNKIKIIKGLNFFGLLHLRDLRLDHNEIKVIEDEGFTVTMVNTFSKLTWIYLNSNQLSYIGADTFYGLPYLKFLNVGQNKIQRINVDGGFSLLPRLNTLVLKDNLLPGIDVATFKHNKVLKHLNMANNKIKSLSARAFLGLQTVEDIDLHGNEIEDVDNDAFVNTPGLLSLRLRKNKLRFFDLVSLRPMKGLKYLDLSRNSISDVRFAGTDHRNLFFFALNDNNLQTLNENITLTMASRGAIHLYDNPWKCDCQFQWVQSVPQSMQVMVADIDSVLCKTPEHLTGEKVISLKSEDFDCHERNKDFYNDQHNAKRKMELGCSFLPDTINESTRNHLKSIKTETEIWLTSFSDSHAQPFCSGVRIAAQWIVTPSKCWKSYSETNVRVQFGDNSEGMVYNTSIIGTFHFQGKLDISLVNIGKIKQESKQRVYPCILNKHGIDELKHQKLPGIFTTTLNHTKKRHAKIRTFPINSRFGSEQFSFKISKKLKSQKFRLLDMPIFVQVGRSRWGLLGMSSEMKNKMEVSFIAYHQALNWMEKILA